jgi:hypothetical protein
MANVSFTLAAALDAGVALAGSSIKVLRQVDRAVDVAGYGINALGNTMEALDVISSKMLNDVKRNTVVEELSESAKRADYGIRLETELLKGIREYKAQSPEVAADYDRLYAKYAKAAGVELPTLVAAAE